MFLEEKTYAHWANRDQNEFGAAGPDEHYKRLMLALKIGKKVFAEDCSGIHETTAEFLRRAGIKAVVMDVATGSLAHNIVFAFDKGKTYIVDYGVALAVDGGVEKALRAYGLASGDKSHLQLMGDIWNGQKYVGRVYMSEGKLIETATGFSSERNLEQVLGIRN